MIGRVANSLRYRWQGFLRRGPSGVERAVRDAADERYGRRRAREDTPWFVSPEDRLTPVGQLNRSGALALAFQFLFGNGLEGDYLEFGSFNGRTFRLAHRHHLTQFAGRTHFWLFDSFQGLPEPKGVDAHPKWHEGQFASTVDDLHAVADLEGIPRTAYTLVPGFYEESLTPALAEELRGKGVRAGIVYVDCDLYESTARVLEFVAPLLQTGSILCFDDWYTFDGDPGRGESLALREFLERRPEVTVQDWVTYGWHGKAVIAAVRS